MGLDMYVYKIEKLAEEEALSLVGQKTEDIRDHYHYIDKETFDEDPEMFSDLLPYINEIPIIDTMFNSKACFADHHIDENDEICGSFYCMDKAGWSFRSGAKIEVTREEYEKYLYEKENLIYVFKSTEVAYWRKFYDLDEFLQNARIICRSKQLIAAEGRQPTNDEVVSWRTENCGYYMLSAEEKRVLKAWLKEHEDDDLGNYHSDWSKLLNDDNSVLMYHAWW